MRNLIKLIRRWLRPTFVVIYDVEHLHQEPTEEYYGYFSSRDEALEMFGTLRQGYELTHVNARLCRVVYDIPDAVPEDDPIEDIIVLSGMTGHPPQGKYAKP